MKNSTAFVMGKMPWKTDFTIRIVIPGIDDGGAVYLEHNTGLRDLEAAESLLDRIMENLPSVKRERRY